jgi:hypothetical protein
MDLREQLKEIHSTVNQCKYASDIILNRVGEIMDTANREKSSFQFHFTHFSLPLLLKKTFETQKCMLTLKKITPLVIVPQN